MVRVRRDILLDGGIKYSPWRWWHSYLVLVLVPLCEYVVSWYGTVWSAGILLDPPSSSTYSYSWSLRVSSAARPELRYRRTLKGGVAVTKGTSKSPCCNVPRDM
eukprot:scaffold424698_cov18-Prasinocladus_malaysianus.AAC.1